MPKRKTMNLPNELRVKMSDGLVNDMEKFVEYSGMNYSDFTRMAIIEYINNHKILLSD